MKAITLIIIASIGMHTSNELVMLGCLLIMGFFIYRELKTEK